MGAVLQEAELQSCSSSAGSWQHRGQGALAAALVALQGPRGVAQLQLLPHSWAGPGTAAPRLGQSSGLLWAVPPGWAGAAGVSWKGQELLQAWLLQARLL